MHCECTNGHSGLTLKLFFQSLNSESNIVDNVVKRATSEQRKVNKRLDVKKLSINRNKTTFIIFHSPHKDVPPHTSTFPE